MHLQKMFKHTKGPFQDVKEYGIFQKNFLINKIEQSILAKHWEFERLISLAQKIKIESQRNNEFNNSQGMLLELKDQILKLNYSDLTTQIDLALAQTEMTENFTKQKQDQSLPLFKAQPNIYGLRENFIKPSHSYQPIMQSISQKKEFLEEINLFNPQIPILDIADSVQSDSFEQNNNNNKSVQLLSRSSTYSSKNPNNIAKDSQVITIDEDYSQFEEKKEEVEYQGQQQQEEQAANLNNSQKEESDDPIHRTLTKIVNMKSNEEENKKEPEYELYLKKLNDFAKRHQIHISSFFMDKDEFLRRHKNKKISVINKLARDDRKMIMKALTILEKQKDVSLLLQIPAKIVSKIKSSKEFKDSDLS